MSPPEEFDEGAIASMAALISQRSGKKVQQKAAAQATSQAGSRWQRVKALSRIMILVAPRQMKPQVRQVVQRLDGYMKRSGQTLAELFAQIDMDGSGSVDIIEFRLGLRSLGLLFDDLSIEALLKVVDTDGDGQLEAHEFCARVHALIEQEATRPQVILTQLCFYLRNNRVTAQALFDEMDTDGTGDFDAAEFQRVLNHIGVEVSDKAAMTAMAALDKDGDGTLETKELAQAVEEFQRQRRVWAAKVLGGIGDYVKKTKLSVQRVFSRVDLDGSGNLDVLELQEALLKLGQSLSELEVEEMMHELDMVGETVTTSLFLDKLKQFEAERAAATAKCADLFAKYDDDNSGTLERDELALLAADMGLGPQLQDPAFLAKLISDIENVRVLHDQDQAQGAEEAGDGAVSFAELLPWFLCVGRSYLPPPSYAATENMEDLSEEGLSKLFERIDDDNSGAICEQETLQAVNQLYPYLGIRNAKIAFHAADRDSGGLIDREEFAALFRCLVYLNKHRHAIDDITEQCDAAGVDEDSFFMACTVLSIEVGNAEASRCFRTTCRTNGCSSEDGLDIDQFLTWAVRRECIDALSASARQEMTRQWMAGELDSLAGEYGDIFFEDLASVVVQGLRREHLVGQQSSQAAPRKHLLKSKLSKAAREFDQRLGLLRSAIAGCMTRTGSFPELTDEVTRSLIHYAETEVFFAGQNIITQGLVGDSFFVIRRGTANVVVTRDTSAEDDEVVVDTVRAGDGVGELGMLYGVNRTATVRCSGPCEVFVIRRANYDTSIKLLPVEKQAGKLEVMMKRFWALVTGPAGSSRPLVDYAAYLKMSMRISKALLSSDDGDSFDEEDQRQIAQEDWASDLKQYGLKVTDSLNQVSFYNSIYELVDTWAGDLEISFPLFLEQLFEHIAEWSEEGHWAFKKLEAVQCDGESFEAIKEQARENAAEAARREKDARAQLDQKNVQEEMRAQNRKAQLEAKKKSHENSKQQASELTELQARLVALDDEERELRRRLAAGGLTPQEEEAIYRRLAEIAQERIQIKLRVTELQKADLRRKLESGALSAEEEDDLRRRLAALDQSSLKLQLEALGAEEAELRRQLASGRLSADEEAKLRQRLAEIGQDRMRISTEMLDAEEAEMKRRINSGLLSELEKELAHQRLAGIAQARVQLKIDALNLEEAELRRRLASGTLSPAEEEAIRARLAALEQERIKLKIEKLELEASELRRRLDCGSLSADEQELALRRLAAIGMECVQLKIDALDAEAVELQRLLDSGNLSEVDERKMRERLAAIAQDRLSLQIEAVELERAELQRRLSSGMLSADEKEAARLRLLELEGQLADLHAKKVELRQQAAQALARNSPGLSPHYQPMRVAPRTPGAVFGNGGWAKGFFMSSQSGNLDLFPASPQPEPEDWTTPYLGLHARGTSRERNAAEASVVAHSRAAAIGPKYQHGTKLRPQQKQLENFEAFLSSPDGKASLRESFEFAQITAKINTTVSSLRWKGASPTPTATLRQRHAGRSQLTYRDITHSGTGALPELLSPSRSVRLSPILSPTQRGGKHADSSDGPSPAYREHVELEQRERQRGRKAQRAWRRQQRWKHDTRAPAAGGRMWEADKQGVAHW